MYVEDFEIRNGGHEERIACGFGLLARTDTQCLGECPLSLRDPCLLLPSVRISMV